MHIQSSHLVRALTLGASLAAMLFIVIEALRATNGGIEAGRMTVALACIGFGAAVTIERYLRLHFSAQKNERKNSAQELGDE